ncbi:MAG: YqeG family HAD IIIA-type phosphatase [Candidatus Coprovivens sp.]
MKNLLLPDIYQQNIYTINYKKLKQDGIKCLLFDLDNTIAQVNVKKPNKEVKLLFQKLEDMGFKVIILSNALKHRLRPFKEELNVDTSPLSCKPLSFKYKKIINLYNYKPEEIAAIGDQIYTDIKGANKMNITSILVNPLSKKESIFTKYNRYKENKLFERNILLERGEYYE